MTEYWKSQEKTFCDICKCWLTDNKSSVDFHKNGKRHKENVEKRLREIQKKNKAEEKKERRFGVEMSKIEKAAAAACQKEAELMVTDISMDEKLANQQSGQGAESSASSAGVMEPKILHRKEKKKPESSAMNLPKPIGFMGSWKPVAAPTHEDLELPSSSRRVVYEPKQQVAQKRKLEFAEKTVDSMKPQIPNKYTDSWVKVEQPSVEFKKRKTGKSNLRQRLDDD